MLPELQKMYTGSSRQARQMSSKVQSPELTREQLLNYHILASQGRIEEVSKNIRAKRQGKKFKKFKMFKSEFLQKSTGEFGLDFYFARKKCRVEIISRKNYILREINKNCLSKLSFL